MQLTPPATGSVVQLQDDRELYGNCLFEMMPLDLSPLLGWHPNVNQASALCYFAAPTHSVQKCSCQGIDFCRRPILSTSKCKLLNVNLLQHARKSTAPLFPQQKVYSQNRRPHFRCACPFRFQLFSQFYWRRLPAMATTGTIQLLLLALLVAASLSGHVSSGARSPSRMLATTGPPVPFKDCKLKYGPWPPSIPKGSTGWNDGQHANMSSFLISFTYTGVKGIKTEWVSFLSKDQQTPSFVTFSHGTVTGRLKATFKWPVKNPNNVPFTQVGGTYNDKYGLDTISFFDSNNNQYIWGNSDNPGKKSFFSPKNKGYVVGFFGANNKTHLTQIGVCMSG